MRCAPVKVGTREGHNFIYRLCVLLETWEENPLRYFNRLTCPVSPKAAGSGFFASWFMYSARIGTVWHTL
jgi:hypothetical protein